MDEMCQVTDNGYKAIAEMYLQRMAIEGDQFFFSIAKYDSIRSCLLTLYDILIREGVCVSVEQLPEQEKQELWKEAKRLCGLASVNKVTAVCKALHALGSFSNN